MFSLPRDTVDVPIPPGPARASSARLRRQDQQLVRRRPQPLRPLSGQRHDARLQRPEVDPRRPLRARHQVLRRGQLRRLQEGRRRARRRDRQRPGPGLGRPLPGRRRPARAPLHPDRHPAHERRRRRSATPARATRRPTSTAASASSALLLSLREQADPQDLIPHLPDLVKALRKAVKTDIPLDQLDELLGLASSVDTKDIRSYVFSPPLYADRVRRQLARLHDRPERPEDPGRGQERVQDQPARRGPAREARRARAPGLGPQRRSATDRGRPTSRATSSTRASRRRRPRQSPRAASRPTRRSWSTTAPRTSSRDTIAYLEKTFGVKVTPATDPASAPTSSSRSARATPKLSAPIGP